MGQLNCEHLGLSVDAQRIRSRNVLVNAQVTAVITILEFLGSCMMLIIRICRMVIGFSSFAGIALFMMIQFVVLSYAYLMNTRYNKHRIVEEGWKNVMKNMSFFQKHNVVIPLLPLLEASKDHNKTNHVKRNPNITEIFLIPATSQLSASDNVMIDLLPNSIDLENQSWGSDMQQPTCSYHVEDLKNDSNGSNEISKKTDSATSMDGIRRNMISDLLYHVDNEEKYVKVLTNFIDAEEADKFGKSSNEISYDYEQLGIDALPNFIGCSYRKSNMRSTKLQNLLHCRQENNNYKTYFEQFVHMEETFVENGC